MACKTSFELYHNFPKLAEESGFTFNTHRPRVHIEWNKIRLVNIENLIRERKFVIIEQHINDILDCVLESEFDVRILDEGVLKIFRLAQLAVEYQQFCRHYLDRSVYVLREEVTVLAQELESTKRLLKEKEEEVRRLKKRSRSAYRTPLPYGNENIATMILKTLNNKSDIFPTLTSTDTIQHNKCTYCDKVFLNQLYLQSHMSRRHANVSEIPQKDVDSNQLERSDENIKLHDELSELRSKLANMEQLVTNLKNSTKSDNKNSNQNNNEPSNSKDIKNDDGSKIIDIQQLVTNLKNTMTNENKNPENKQSFSKEMKDAEVSTNSEGYILDKIEEWKKEERDKYNKEINLLRTQIIAMLDSFKEKEKDTTAKNDVNVLNALHETIKQQGQEIMSLKKELLNSKSSPNPEELTQRKEMEAQMAYWVKRAELQTNEYKLLLQKLDVVAKEAEKSRAIAETEKKRVLQLQNLLQEKNNSPKNPENVHDKVEPTIPESVKTDPAIVKSKPKTNLIRDNISIKKLQQKAQELLDMQNTSTSDNSVSSDEKVAKAEKEMSHKDEKKYDYNNTSSPVKKEYNHKKKQKTPLRSTETPNHKGNKGVPKDKSKTHLKETLYSKKENGRIIPGSPMKVIRAKITEEVNNRLVALGVDPLKTRLPENIFSKQKLQLQEQQQVKFKKNPGSEQVFHTLLAHLDSNAATLKTAETSEYHNSPSKNIKSFSLSSVISNVKTKALSLVKPNDHNKTESKSYDNVAKRAMMLLRTPPSSTNSSPKLKAQDKSPAKATEVQNSKEEKGNNKKSKLRTPSYRTQETLKNYETDTDSSVSEINEHEDYLKNRNQASATIENLVKSPTRRPSDMKLPNFTINTENKNILPDKSTTVGVKSNANLEPTAAAENSSDDVESLIDQPPRRAYSVENMSKLTKGVLKNASSTSSLNKKKVLFDMDAIQMKSVSASSPSQSITDKNDNMEKYGLGLVNLDNEEWDISSIENEPVQKNPVVSRTSPKIAELRETIESQLTKRNATLSTALVGGVDLLSGPLLNKTAAGSKGGSNTSLGSSILDDTDSTPGQNQVAFVKPRTFIEKDDSEIDISEFVTDELITKNTNIIKAS